MINLRRLRKEKGWTQGDVAKIVGVTKTAIHDIETGKRQGSIPVWDALEDLFGVSQRELRDKTKAPDGNQACKQ